jgi:hypothetical protein
MFVGIKNALAKLCPHFNKPHLNGKDSEYHRYIDTGYPSNHTYQIKKEKLKPNYKLASRYKKIKKLLPEHLTSLGEVGCSKGFFIFSATEHPHCTRGLGIDVNQYDIDICNWVKSTMNNTRATFAKMQLHELASRIEEFGGPLQTLLILNTYQYLYFGSDPFPECYLDHDAIFKNLRKICTQRIIFNNRISLNDCQNVTRIAEANEVYRQNYSEEKALEAAARYFIVKHHGKIGKYPLITMDAKPM